LRKNTLYITFDGLSDPLGRSQILPYLIGIAQAGFAITILSCEKEQALKLEKEKIDSLIKDLPIKWSYILYDQAGGFLSKISHVKQLKSLARTIVATNKIELTHCRSYLASLIGLELKIKSHIPFVFDMRGYWADERFDGNIWHRSNLLHQLFYTYFKRKEKQFIHHSDAIVSLTNAAKTDLANRFPNDLIELKTEVIPCCTNTELFDRQSIQKQVAIDGVNKDDLLLVYTGSIGTWYYTQEMIDCVAEWRKLIPNIKLLILTKDRNEINVILSNYSKEIVEIIKVESASYQDVPFYLARANAAIFFIKPAYSKIASSPTKMAECWAMNLPIITNVGIGDNDLYFKTHHGGVLVDSFDVEAYRKACLSFLNELPLNHNYRKIACDHFDTRLAIKKYITIYNKLSS
jgi:glycosyltransferase involved in cell wall biosynthesis